MDSSETIYNWEKKYKGSWEIFEDQTNLDFSSKAFWKKFQHQKQKTKRERLLKRTKKDNESNIRKGIIRTMFLVIDLSSSVQENVFQQPASSLMMNSNPLERPASAALTSVSSCTGPMQPGDAPAGELMSEFGENSDQMHQNSAKQSKKAQSTDTALSNLFFADEADSELSAMAKYTTRQDLVLAECIDFVNTFFDLNPLSQLGVIVLRAGIAQVIQELTGKRTEIIDALKRDDLTASGGFPSVQNGLNLAMKNMEFLASYSTREVLIVYSSLFTQDPASLWDTMEAVSKKNIRVSVIGSAAEVNILRKITQKTNGMYYVLPKNSAVKLKEHLAEFTKPLPFLLQKELSQQVQAQKKAEMIEMGFPMKRAENTKSLCVCHRTITHGGYMCPRCNSKYCELPIDCSICGLKLVSSPHLARSYHHLFPVQQFVEIEDEEIEKEHSNRSAIGEIFENEENSGKEKVCIMKDLTNGLQAGTADEDLQFWYCTGCRKPLEKGGDLKLMCPNCKCLFCVECDIFIHESLHNCPGCSV